MAERAQIIVVDDESDTLAAMLDALTRRYGADYRVVPYLSPCSALAGVRKSKEENEEIALVIADQRMPEMAGREFLGRVRSIVPTAKRALVVAWGDREASPTILQACALGELDNYLYKPWAPAEIHLYPFIGEFLAEWTRIHRPGMELIRVIGDDREFFYSFRLDEAVPDDHPVRTIAAVLDLSWVHAELAPFYPKVGRPSIDPVLMIRMLVVGYVFAIRSERALCREVRVNLAYRWFCGLSIEDKIPNHSAFSRVRHERFRESDVFRRVFERVVEACIAAGLIGGEGFAVDASLIVADANKQRSIPGTEWKKACAAERASRATREYLATLDDAAFGAASDVTPKFVSPSDPAAQWTGAMRGPAFFAYADNYLIDVKFGIIVDVEASRAIRRAEVG